MNADRLNELKEGLREIIANKGWIPDQESFNLLYQIVVGTAVEICVVDTRGRLLLANRRYDEWPGEPKIHDWYIPGGLVKPSQTLESACEMNLIKDHIQAATTFLGTADVIKWLPGEHPFGWVFTSIPCICLLHGEITLPAGREKDFKFVGEVCPTTVPHHTDLQRNCFTWIKEHPAFFPDRTT